MAELVVEDAFGPAAPRYGPAVVLLLRAGLGEILTAGEVMRAHVDALVIATGQCVGESRVVGSKALAGSVDPMFFSWRTVSG